MAQSGVSSVPGLRRVLGVRDLALFYFATTFSLRWIAAAAGAGPSALSLWVFAAAAFFVPLAFAVLDLSARHPEEGGIYVWSRTAFGPFAGFLTGWAYWAANLPYFPSLLYFGAANALFMGGPETQQALSGSSSYFFGVALAGIGLAAGLNILGLGVGKWITNAGGLAIWIAVSFLPLAGGYCWWRYGSATAFPPSSFLPGTTLKDFVFLSTIAFAYGGLEGASTMGDEIAEPARTVPRAILWATGLITGFYMVGTAAILLALPREQVTGLQGFMQATQAIALKVDAPWLVPFLALCVTVATFGGVAGWFAATARLPFVAGVDALLPPAFGRVHPRWHTPHVALIVQAVAAVGFIWLGQAGTSVRGAYEALVSMSIIVNFVPFLFMFAAVFRFQREPLPAGAVPVPGGPVVARLLAVVGFVVTALAILLACVPGDAEPDKALAVMKIVGASSAILLLGAGLYWSRSGSRRG